MCVISGTGGARRGPMGGPSVKVVYSATGRGSLQTKTEHYIISDVFVTIPCITGYNVVFAH